MLSIDRPTFYAYVRRAPFGGRLTKQQVTGVEQLLDAWNQYGTDDLDGLAYVLAGVHHETGGRMVPVREGFAESDQAARNAVASLFRQGRIKRNYAIPINGISYYGRGRIQNTHFDNYQRLEQRFKQPFVTDPDILIRDGETDAMVTVVGHIEGIWTRGAHKLRDYFGPAYANPVGARRIVNGTDKAQLISTYYTAFLDALREAAKVYEDSTFAAAKKFGGAENVDDSLQEAVAAEVRPADVTPEAAKPDTPDLKKDKVTIGTLLAGIGGAGTIAPFMQYMNNPWAVLAMTVLLIGAFLIVSGRLDLIRKKGA